MQKYDPRKFQKIGLLLALTLVIFVIIYSSVSVGAWLHSPGKMNVGHEKLPCNYCHKASNGSYRQQIQANLQFIIGNRVNPVEIGHLSINNSVCIQCHRRPKDQHPVYRFLEPRFTKAREALKPQYCVSCHLEHQGVRITSENDNCKTCHKKLKLKNDPIDVSHANLIKLAQWKTCLGCHDFHGNHKMKTAKLVKQRYTANEIDAYFSGEIQLYSTKKIYTAKKVLK